MRRLAAVFLGFLAGAVLCEGALRLQTLLEVARAKRGIVSQVVPAEPEQSWLQYDPVTGWRNKPNAVVERCYPSGAGVHIDAEGFRGIKDYGLRPPKGVKRILLIGDSVGFGHGVADDQTMAALLERRLPGVEVLNLGVVAYGLDQITLLYEQYGRRYHPDLVLLVPGVHFGRIDLYSWPFGYGRPKFLLQGGQLVLTNVPVPLNQPPGGNVALLSRTTPSQVLNALLDPHLRLPGWLREAWVEWRWRRDVSGDRDPNEDLGEALLLRLKGDVAQDGARLVYVVCPHRHWIRGGEDGFRRRLLAFLTGAGIDFVDPTPAFAARETDSAATSLYNDVHDGKIESHAAHWSVRGNRLAADVVAGYLAGRTNSR